MKRGPFRLKDLLPGGKPGGPGIRLNQQFYLSVLAARAQMPLVRLVCEPKGRDGAVVGYVVPLRAGAEKGDLERPLERGVYGVTSLDRKTILRLTVVSKEEAGFDPTSFLLSEAGRGLPAPIRDRVAGTWTLLQLTIDSHDPALYPALGFMLQVSARLAELTDGVVADPLAQRYLLPEGVLSAPRPGEPFAVDDVIQLLAEGGQVRTAGLAKLNRPEMGVETFDRERGERFLRLVAAEILKGRVYADGEEFLGMTWRDGVWRGDLSALE